MYMLFHAELACDQPHGGHSLLCMDDWYFALYMYMMCIALPAWYMYICILAQF